MPKSTDQRHTGPLIGRAGAVILVVAAVVAGMLVATALASKGSPKSHHAKKSGLAVFSHHPKRLARIAATSSLTPPPGAILAAVVGDTEVYALSNASGEDCVIHLTAGSGGGSVCSPAAKVEAEGEVGIGGGAAATPGSLATVRVTALVPNGVTSVKFTDRDGTSYSVPVTNNVAEHDDANVASVSYTLLGGGSHTTDVAGTVDQIPRQPSAASSSN